MGPFSFRKNERLHSQKRIRELFEKGSSFYLHPFKVFVLAEAGGGKHQMLISVPNRLFSRAVDRNLVKRRVREAYRLAKPKLPQSKAMTIGLVYSAREILAFQEIHQKITLILGKVEKVSGPVGQSGNV